MDENLKGSGKLRPLCLWRVQRPGRFPAGIQRPAPPHISIHDACYACERPDRRIRNPGIYGPVCRHRSGDIPFGQLAPPSSRWAPAIDLEARRDYSTNVSALCLFTTRSQLACKQSTRLVGVPELQRCANRGRCSWLEGGYMLLDYRHITDCHGELWPFARWQYYRGGYKKRRMRLLPKSMSGASALNGRYARRWSWSASTSLPTARTCNPMPPDSRTSSLWDKCARFQFQINY